MLFLLLAIVALLCPSCCPRTKTAAWVVRYDIDTPAEIDAICSAAKQTGFDELLIQVRGRADAYYRSDIALWPENLSLSSCNFDPLRQTIEKCSPVKLHAWLNVFYLWGDDSPPQNPNHPAAQSQPWILADNEGRPLTTYSRFEKTVNWLEGVYADPASAEYRKLFVAVVTELISRYRVSGVHLDFIRYPGPSFGGGGPLGQKYAEEMGMDPRLLPEHISRELLFDWLWGRLPLADRVLVTAALYWREMRATEVSALLRDVSHALKVRGKRDVRLSVAVFPDPGQAYLENGQDWRTWEREGLVDALYPMTYFGKTDRIGAQLREVAAGTYPDAKIKLWAGLGAYIKDVKQIGEEASIARQNGYTGIALFSLGHLLRKTEDIEGYAQSLRGAVSYSDSSFAPL